MNQIPKGEAYFLSKEAAEIIGVSPSTLGNWRRTGRHAIPFIRVGSRIVYEARALKDFLNRDKNAPIPYEIHCRIEQF